MVVCFYRNRELTLTPTQTVEINNKENYAGKCSREKQKIYKVFSRVDRTQQAAGADGFSGNLLKLY